MDATFSVYKRSSQCDKKTSLMPIIVPSRGDFLYCELHFLYSALINISKDEVVVYSLAVPTFYNLPKFLKQCLLWSIGVK